MAHKMEQGKESQVKEDRPGITEQSGGAGPVAQQPTKKAATREDITKFVHTDRSLSVLTTFEQDQLIERLAAMFL